MSKLSSNIIKDRTSGRYGKELVIKNNGVTEYYQKKSGWITRIENPKAKGNEVQIVQSGKYSGYTAEIYNPKTQKVRYIGHSKNATEFARKLSKKYKVVQFLD